MPYPNTPEGRVLRKAATDRYRARNPEKVKASNRRWSQANPEKRASYHQRRAYGLSPEAYAEVWDRQKGLCAICFCALTGRKTHIDHNHTTGEVRGVLCVRCNTGLGHVERVGFVEACRAYLGAR